MAASPDPRYIAFTVFEDYFVDKETGAPLSDGLVTFYKDNSRTVKKPVFQLTGAPPNYSFSALPNPCELSAVGTFQDGTGNNIVPYFFPYDSQGNIELYYITVTSAAPGLVEQFVREAQPPNVMAIASISNGDDVNLISNGQFLIHNDIVSPTNPPITTIDGVDIQPIAQGGWFFKHTTGGTSTFANEFVRLDSATSGANDFPLYAFNFICNNFDPTDVVRDFGYAWGGVYTFSGGNPPGEQPYTLMVEAFSLDANVYTYQVIMTQNFGSGSPTSPIETNLGTIVTTDSFSYFVKNDIFFPADNGVLGDNNDDYVSIALRGPASSWRSQVRCWALVIGNKTFTFYPPEPNTATTAQAVFGALPIPASDGSDLYLKVQYTPTGMKFDYSEIGNIVTSTNTKNFSSSVSTITNEILCDGSAYPKSGYSPLGIPYSRLWNELWSSTTVLPDCGTGVNFATSYIPTPDTTILRITTNIAGPQAAVVDGTPATGFTFSALYTGNTAYALNTYISTTNSLCVAIGKVGGAVTSATPNTSGLTVTQIYNSASLQQIFTVSGTVLPAGGTYFKFSNTVPTNYYVWFTVNGSGADPAPGGTGILVPLLSTYTISTAVSMIREAIGGYQASNVTMAAASTLTGGDNFKFTANSILYTVVYVINGVGTLAGSNVITVNLTGTETADEVATATQLAINSYQYAVPNLKGAILKGSNVGASNIPGDLNFAQRFGLNDIFNPDGINSYEWGAILEHAHTFTAPLITSVAGEAQLGGTFDVWNQENSLTGNTGGSENNPFNYNVNYAIKY